MVKTSISASQPAIHKAANGLDCVRFMRGMLGGEGMIEGRPVSASLRRFATRKSADAAMREASISLGG
jgi:hypothetical protein